MWDGGLDVDEAVQHHDWDLPIWLHSGGDSYMASVVVKGEGTCLDLLEVWMEAL